jgi:hypothetical protein
MKGEVESSVIDIQSTRVIGERELSSQIIRRRNIQASESDITKRKKNITSRRKRNLETSTMTMPSLAPTRTSQGRVRATDLGSGG